MSVTPVTERVLAREVYEETGILYSDMTDGGGAAATYTCKFTLPVGFYVEHCWLTDVTGFTGDSTAVAIIGDGSTTNRFNTGTPSVFTTTSYVDMGAVSGTPLITTAVRPVITVTEDSEWGDVSAGALSIHIIGYMWS